MSPLTTRCFLLFTSASVLWAEGGAPAPAPGGAPAPVPGSAPDPMQTNDGAAPVDPLGGLLPLVIVMGILMLFMWTGARRQKKEESAHKEMVNNLKTGQRVRTAGGIEGTVVRVGEKDVDIETGNNGSTFTVIMSGINKVLTDEDDKD